MSTILCAEMTEIESSIASIWMELLGVAKLDLNDHFFELGAQSLLGTRLLACLQDRYGIVLTLQHLLDAPTLGEQACLVEHAMLCSQGRVT